MSKYKSLCTHSLLVMGLGMVRLPAMESELACITYILLIMGLSKPAWHKKV
jgi:hypothetical protein